MFGFFKKKESTDTHIAKPVEPKDYGNIEAIASYFKEETGVTFEKQMSILKNKVTTFCKHREIHSFATLLKTITHDEALKQELIDYLTTNETFFYREFKQIEELIKLVKNSLSDVRILCAPSATGEEPYSIAIALLEAGVAAKKFNIIGIDINSQALKKAHEAIYKERNVRNLSTHTINKYFEYSNNRYILKNSIKSLVTFKQLNIFDDSLKSLGKFDFIFCRNMLIYFDQETKIKAKNILEDLRKDDTHAIFFGHADLF